MSSKYDSPVYITVLNCHLTDLLISFESGKVTYNLLPCERTNRTAIRNEYKYRPGRLELILKRQLNHYSIHLCHGLAQPLD